MGERGADGEAGERRVDLPPDPGGIRRPVRGRSRRCLPRRCRQDDRVGALAAVRIRGYVVMSKGRKPAVRPKVKPGASQRNARKNKAARKPKIVAQTDALTVTEVAEL